MTIPGLEEPAVCMPANCFCEKIHEDIIKQPMNSYSSFIFILFGILIILKFNKSNNSNSVKPFYSSLSYRFLYVLSLFLIGIGSFYYHSQLNFWGQFADVSGMNLLASFLLVYHLKRKNFISNFIIYYFFINLFLAYFLFSYPFLRRYLFGFLLVLSLIPLYIPSIKTRFIINLKYNEKTLPQGFLLNNNNHTLEESPLSMNSTNYRFFWIALVSQLIAFFFWILDITKLACDENSFFQGHSVWHILSGVSCYYLFLFYESESIKKDLIK
jgi:hypothetical protein